NNRAFRAFDQKNYTYWFCYIYENAPQWWQLNLSKPELIQNIEIDFVYDGNTPRDYDVQAWTGYTWFTLVQVKDNRQTYVVHEFKNAYRTQRLRLLFKRAPEYTPTITLYEVYILKTSPVSAVPQPLFDDPDRPDGKYTYRVSAVDTYGLESPLSAEVVVPVGDVTPPAAPIQLTVTPDQADVNLTWTPNTEPDLSGYHVYRQTSQGWVKLNPTLVTGNTFKDVGLANGTYNYRVTATDQIGNESEPSNEALAVINIGVPQPPINLQIIAIPEGQALRICWEYNGAPAAGFNLYRALLPGGPYVRVNQELIKDTCYLDEGLINGVKYYYYVTAVDNFGNESGSSPEQYAVPKDIVAPEPPVIFYPTLNGIPLEVEQSEQTLIGFAEPESRVELFQDEKSLGYVIARKSAEEQNYTFSSNTYQTAISPDGRKVAFIENSYLYLRDLDTNQTIALNESYINDMRWQPDSKKLSYRTEDENGNDRIFIYDLGTGQKSRLTDDTNGWEYSPSWSRDGKRVAFISYRNNEEEVWIKDIVSGEMKSIMESQGASYPEISPDGSKVVYFKNSSLYQVDMMTGESRSINSIGWPGELGNYGWSPDSKYLAFISFRSGANELYIQEVQSGAVDLATGFQAAGLTLHGIKWSPDANAILCLTQNENEYAFWTLTVAGPHTPILLKKVSSGSIQAMDWISIGQVVYQHYVDDVKNQLGLIQLPGFFAFDVVLNPGENIFDATATDAAGNRSGSSDPVTLSINHLPDLAITTDTIFVYPAAPIVGDQVKVYAVVENKGLADAEGFRADVYLKNSQEQWVLLKQEYIDRIAAGASVAIPITLEAAAYPGSNTLIVFVDAENRVYELSETNNFAQRDFYTATQEGIVMTTVLDAQEYPAESDLAIQVAIHNSGSARKLDLAVQIVDENEAIVYVYDPITLNLAYGTGKDIDLQWNTGLTYAGHYRVRAILKENGKVILENLTPFRIVPEISLSAELSTDKLHYDAMEDVLLNVLLLNQGRNFDIPHLDVKLWVQNADNTVFTKSFGLDNIPAGSNINLSAIWNTGLSATGNYKAHVEFLLEGQVIANSVADFFIDPEIKLSGTLKAVPVLVYFNRPVRADFTVRNTGNAGLDELAI
ncbi:MAG: hypothetical protein EHM45_20000, partial [Desulfobacteraceae bacterium]